MDRSDFLKLSLLGGLSMVMEHKADSFLKGLNNWPDLGYEMPVMFVGHGAPNIAAEPNEYTQSWSNMAHNIPTPKAILCISAHWLTQGITKICSAIHPETIYDFGGMDERLYRMKYPAPGSPELAEYLQRSLTEVNTGLDQHWGFDHGTWCVLYHMFPEAKIPVLQLSIDYSKGELFHFNLGQQLAKLRKKGILILSSGNIVHNLNKAIFDENARYDWAMEYDRMSKNWLEQRDDAVFLNRSSQGNIASLAIPTPDHYYPLLYTLGLKNRNDELQFFNEKVNYGSISMRSMVYGANV